MSPWRQENFFKDPIVRPFAARPARSSNFRLTERNLTTYVRNRTALIFPEAGGNVAHFPLGRDWTRASENGTESNQTEERIATVPQAVFQLRTETKPQLNFLDSNDFTSIITA